MSELVFGPSADWLPLINSQYECLQPRLDGGYDVPKIKKIGDFICHKIVSRAPDSNQPTLFDEISDTICETESTEELTLFDINSNEY